MVTLKWIALKAQLFFFLNEWTTPANGGEQNLASQESNASERTTWANGVEVIEVKQFQNGGHFDLKGCLEAVVASEAAKKAHTI